MNNPINFIPDYLHKTFSRLDPANVALKRSVKTFLAVILAVTIFHNNLQLALFAGLSSFLLSRAQSGFTLRQRKTSMITTGFLIALFAVPLSLIADNRLLSVIIIIIWSFISFFLSGQKIVPDFNAIAILSMGLITLVFSDNLTSGLIFGGVFLSSTVIVFTFHFLIFPTHPKKRMITQTGIIISRFDNYFDSIIKNYNTLEDGIRITQEKNTAVKQSVSDLKRLWNIFNVNIGKHKSFETNLHYLITVLEKYHEFLILLWQFRAITWDSALYSDFLSEQKDLKYAFNKILFDIISENSDEEITLSFYKLRNKVEMLDKEYIKKLEKTNIKNHLKDKAAVINTIHMLHSLLNEKEITRKSTSSDEQSTSLKKDRDNIFQNIKNTVNQISFKTTSFKYGLRAAIIIGLCMIFYKYFRVDYGYWIVIFAIFLIKPSLGISVKSGSDRILGTIVGCLLALGFINLINTGSPVFYSALFLSIFLMIYFANLGKIVPMIISVSFMIICIFTLKHPGNDNIALLRILYTAGVVLVVIFISFFLWPDKAMKKVGKVLYSALDAEKNYFTYILDTMQISEVPPQIAEIKNIVEEKISYSEKILEISRSEFFSLKNVSLGFRILVYIKRLLNTLVSFEASVKNIHDKKTLNFIKPEIISVCNSINDFFDIVANSIRTRNLPETWPDTDKYFDELKVKFRTIKTEGNEKSELIMFREISTFLWNLWPINIDLKGIKNLLEDFNNE